MRKYLITKEGNFYKANLHCHSTCSDGKLTPEELKEVYMKHGYSVVAYTDHFMHVPHHHELSDENFVALNGVELDCPNSNDMKRKKTTHLCCIAIEPDNHSQVCYHREKYVRGNMLNFRDKIYFDENEPDFEREYSAECINKMIKDGVDKGFYVTYNHPVWSLHTFDDYSKYEGMHAMEICNYASYRMGFAEYNAKIYDDLLRQNKRISVLGTDDNHNGKEPGSVGSDSFGAFTMIKAPRLDYKEITSALLRGDFYASMGPLINDVYFEDGIITIKCSSAERIFMTTATRKQRCVFREKGKKLTSASFEVAPDDVYVRISVVDKQGRYADTNAFFTDNLFD